MRKIFSLIAASVLVLCLGVQPLGAQSLGLGADGFGLGIEAGLNVSDLSVDDGQGLGDFHAETGVRAGAVLRYGFGPVLGFQTGASFSQKGASAEQEIGTSQQIEIDYLEIPLLLQLNVPTGPAPVNPRLFAGGTVNIEVACDLTIVGEAAVAESECGGEEDVLDTNATDLGFLFGAGLDFPAGPGALTVDLRFDLGLSDINDVADSPELKNRNFQATAGYILIVP